MCNMVIAMLILSDTFFVLLNELLLMARKVTSPQAEEQMFVETKHKADYLLPCS